MRSNFLLPVLFSEGTEKRGRGWTVLLRVDLSGLLTPGDVALQTSPSG